MAEIWRDIYFDEDAGDFKPVVRQGQLKEFWLTSGLEAIRQRLAFRLRLVMGEWFMDIEKGVDYFGSVLGQRSMSLPEAELTRAILSTPNIRRLKDPLTLSFVAATRTLEVSFQCDTDSGELFYSSTLGVGG